MKRVVGLILAVSFMLTGCSLTAFKGNKGAKEIGGTITVITDRTDADKLFEKIEEDFIKLHPNVKDIVWESSTDYDKYIATRMNTTDYGDVLFVPFSMAGKPSDYENYFMSLGTVEELGKEYIDVTEADYNSNVYGLPVALNSLGIIYNEDVLKQAGVEKMPVSTEEMINACEKIKKNTKAVPFYTNYNRTLGIWGGALTSYGGEKFKSDILNKGTAFQKGQPIREVMDIFYELSSRGLTEPDPVTGDYAKSLSMLAKGEVAMLMMGSQEVPKIQKQSSGQNNIKIAPFPVKYNGKTSIPFGAPAVIGINKNTKNPETAKAFLEYFVSKASGYSDSFGGMSPKRADLNGEQKKLFTENNIILTVPNETPETEAKYSAIANEVGVGRLNSLLQKVINIGLYPKQNESYEEYTKTMENNWDKAVKSKK